MLLGLGLALNPPNALVRDALTGDRGALDVRTIWLVAAIAAVAALVTAIGLIVSGAIRVTAALIDRPDAWPWLFLGGLISLVVGGMAIAWPDVTVLALALLLGIRMIVFGVVEIASALQLRSLGRSLEAPL